MLNTLTRNLGLDDSILQSTPATFYAEAHPNSLIAKSIEIQTTVRLMKSSTFSYLDCSSDQQSMIAAVIQPLLNYTDHTVQYMMSMNIAVTPRFTTWFGRYSLFNVITVRKRYANINAALSTQSIFFNCGCTASNDTYAYVYPKIPYIIFLCTQFWAADITGTNSKVGTIIHETSHFTIVAGTTDQMYGQEGCLQLATSDPVGATNNADNFEYFAENDPMLT
jgi:peptidyl-Lys metalloendopeptidase